MPTHSYIDPDGIEFIVDFTITSYGSPAHMGSLTYPGDPGDPPEWEVESIESQGRLINPNVPANAELMERIDADIAEKFDFTPDDDVDWIE